MEVYNNENLIDLMSQDEIENVIKLLKNSDQTLIFLDSIICPVRDYIGQSHLDIKMKELAEKLKQAGIIQSYSGFSAGHFPFFLHITSFSLTNDFFEIHRKPHYEQLELSL